MPIDIDGVGFFSANEMAEACGVSRQTLWRWRRQGVVPQGRRFRDRQLLFTQSELEQVQDYANRVEPIDLSAREQLKLFNGAA
ncbi:MAG TPA: helix-turn-helix domain-containing protein [Longimicrobium sp.]|jgi:predicted DNA-binding transcriptional regulator AlpA|nr:helix-turn-helix domain-containing protein [Longimicrobium sp.]